MKRWHKFVLALSVFSVLLSFFVVSAFADSVSPYGDTNLKPFFAPSSVRLYDSEYTSVDFSLFSVVTVNTQTLEDTVIGSNVLRDSGDDIWCNREYYLSPPSSNSDGSFNFRFNDLLEFNTGLIYPDRLEFFFNDYYFSGDPEHFSSIFDLSVVFSSPYYDIPIYSLILSCDIVYLESDHLSTDSFTYSSSLDFQASFRELENYLFSNYLDGALVTNMSVFVEAEDYFSKVRFDGTIRYVDQDLYLGSYAALDAWSNRYGDTIIGNTPTILESVQIGLDAVWNTSLFGLFTIGQVFSACAGLALFTWLLKIFNR